MKPDKELIGATTKLLVLGVLSKSANYGYKIVKQLNREAEDLFEWREGTIYPVLHKLEKEGMIISEWQVAPNGRRRKYYAITKDGSKALAKQSKEWSAFHRLVSRIAPAFSGGFPCLES